MLTLLPNRETGDGPRRYPECSIRRSCIVAAISPCDRFASGSPTQAASLSEIASHPADAVLVIEPKLLAAFDQSAEQLWRLFPPGQSALVALVSRRPAPSFEVSSDGLVCSFMCSPALFRQLIARTGEVAAQSLCFELFEAVLNGELEPSCVLARQIPDPVAAVLPPDSTPPAALLMAHRGDQNHLRTALRYLHKCTGSRLQIRIGLDVKDSREYRALRREYPAVEFFRCNPVPVGPYVIRQALADRSTEALLTLQDSDDIPCSDRFQTLAAHLASSGCDMIGSHELRVDEIRREVVVMRFPLDVIASLHHGPSHAFLHATCMIRRKAFLAAGGLSTNQLVANDTQFLMRAFFYLRIRNVDEFLYIRRRHGGSLTVAPKTANGNPLRLRLDARWRADFEAIKQGAIKLEKSSLRPMHSSRPYSVRRLPPFGTTQIARLPHMSPGAFAAPEHTA
jgi:hypothetical protein